jgi:hypothetical protein
MSPGPTPIRVSTVLLTLGIAASLFWLASAMLGTSNSRALNSAQVCLVYVGHSDKVLPNVCISGEARAPHDSSDIVVVLSRENLTRFLKVVDEQEVSARKDRSAFATYEVHNSVRSTGSLWTLNDTQTRAVIQRLEDLADSEYRASETASLNDLLALLDNPVKDPVASRLR